MKKFIYLFLFILFGITEVYSQVTIGSSEKPDDSAILDLKQNDDGTSNKGLLIPRVKLVETSDSSPLSSFVEGLIVYNIETINDVEHGFYYCDGSQWILLKPADDVTFPTEPWLVTDTDEQATSVVENIYHLGEVVIGRSGQVEPTAQLEVYSDSKGFLMPRLSKIQRDAIPDPIESLMIWNIDEGCYNFFAQGKWKSMCGDFESLESTVVVNCDNIKIEGNYDVGVPLDETNFIRITVQVSGPSSLRLEGITQDGFYFQRSGRVLSSGSYTYDIPGYGTPREEGTFPLTINLFNNNKQIEPVCLQNVTVKKTNAEFSSMSLVSVDPLTKGQSSAGKTMVLNVNVTEPGQFNFYSNTINGIQYTSSNQSLTVGPNNVILYTNGALPIDAGTYNYTVSGNGSLVTLVVPVVVNTISANATINCTKTKVVGKFVKGQATTTANYIECTADFTTIGSWAVNTAVIDGVQFEGKGSVTKIGTQILRLYAKGTPTSVGTKNFNIVFDENNTSNNCTAAVSVLIPSKNILLIGDVSSAINDALMNLSNFGPNGKSKIANINIIEPKGQNPNAATLADLIESNNIDIVLAGWHFKPDYQTSGVIANSIIKKNGFYFQVQGQSLQNYLPDLLKQAYNYQDGIAFTSNGYPLRAAQLPNIDSPYLNGVFGDCRGKYFRVDDDASWMGLIPNNSTPSLQHFIHLPAYKNNNARDVFIYADGFFLISDWGALSGKNDASYGTFSPIRPSSAELKNQNVWSNDTYNTKFTINSGDIINWVLFGNIMDHIFNYTKKE